MRTCLLLFLIFVLANSCIKKKSIGPVPEIEFLNFTQKTSVGNDSATFQLSYIDSDGDLFRNKSSDGPNLVMKPYEYVADSNLFRNYFSISKAIIQPADGYYKDKSIQGYIYLNESEFRFSNKTKVIRFETFMIDMAGNKSNLAVSPTYTLKN